MFRMPVALALCASFTTAVMMFIGTSDATLFLVGILGCIIANLAIYDVVLGNTKEHRDDQ